MVTRSVSIVKPTKMNADKEKYLKRAKSFREHEPGPEKRTSIGHSVRSRPKNKHKRRSFKKYRGQGKKR